MFTINYYQLPDGRKPVEEFIDSLPLKLQAKAFRSMELLEEYGNTLQLPHARYMDHGLYELRIQFANDIARIFYFFVVDNQIIVTNGFIKKTMKTPRGELERARKYKADYERRFLHE